MTIEIIAEIAQGYEGNPELAAHLIRAAAAAKANGVKLQLVYADELATADYKHYELFKSLEMTDGDWTALGDLAKQQKIDLYLDIFGKKSLALAERAGVKGIKIHSTDMSNLGLLEDVANSGINLVLLSIGGCFRHEIDEALHILSAKHIVLLHGFQGYPTPLESNQVARLHELIRLYGSLKNVTFGFADHVPAEDGLKLILSVLGVGTGVGLIEKHLTLSQVMKFEDHEAALNPDEFAAFVTLMRQCYSAYGSVDSSSPDFGMHSSEKAYRAMTHKHVVASRKLQAATTITPDMVGLKRTSSTSFIYDLREVYGKKLILNVEPDTAITASMLGEAEQ
jgi:sialic acid synthase SpsE